jgi:hypothetical protein
MLTGENTVRPVWCSEWMDNWCFRTWFYTDDERVLNRGVTWVSMKVDTRAGQGRTHCQNEGRVVF